jgi:hypothetical protein
VADTGVNDPVPEAVVYCLLATSPETVVVPFSNMKIPIRSFAPHLVPAARVTARSSIPPVKLTVAALWLFPISPPPSMQEDRAVAPVTMAAATTDNLFVFIVLFDPDLLADAANGEAIVNQAVA